MVSVFPSNLKATENHFVRSLFLIVRSTKHLEPSTGAIQLCDYSCRIIIRHQNYSHQESLCRLYMYTDWFSECSSANWVPTQNLQSNILKSRGSRGETFAFHLPSNNHILRELITPQSNKHYDLRPRPRNYVLPQKDYRNRIPRQLYKYLAKK